VGKHYYEYCTEIHGPRDASSACRLKQQGRTAPSSANKVWINFAVDRFVLFEDEFQSRRRQYEDLEFNFDTDIVDRIQRLVLRDRECKDLLDDPTSTDYFLPLKRVMKLFGAPNIPHVDLRTSPWDELCTSIWAVVESPLDRALTAREREKRLKKLLRQRQNGAGWEKVKTDVEASPTNSSYCRKWVEEME
jgi:hypothetical protein